MYQFTGKIGQFYKFNANCKQEEKSGIGPGSCGGSQESDLDNKLSPYQKSLEKLLSIKPRDKRAAGRINSEIKELQKTISDIKRSMPHKNISSENIQQKIYKHDTISRFNPNKISKTGEEFKNDDLEIVKIMPMFKKEDYLNAIYEENKIRLDLKMKKAEQYQYISADELTSYMNSLSFSEYKSLYTQWVGVGFVVPLNTSLREGLDISDKESIETLKNIDSAIKKYTTKNKIVVYRGISNIPSMRKIKKGDTFSDNGYSGTTEDIDHAKGFLTENGDNYLLKITVPKGSNIAPVSGLKEMNVAEREWLLPRNSKFYVNNIVEKGNKKILEVTLRV